MTSRFSIALAAPLLVSGLALAGCKTEAQKEVDQQAEAIDDSFEAEADLREAIAAGAPNAVQAQVRNQADALQLSRARFPALARVAQQSYNGPSWRRSPSSWPRCSR